MTFVYELLVWLAVFIFGLSVGSFLNVLIYRLPRELSLGGRSFCPKCKKKISWYDNVPLLSYVLLKGRCRRCQSPISWQYPIVELATGLLFVMGFQGWLGEVKGYQELLPLFYLWFLFSALVVIFVIDLKHEIIPDSVLLPAILVSLPYSILYTPYPIQSAVISSLFLLFLHLITRGRGMGFGDVKYAFLMGLVLGFPKVILAFYGAFLTGAIIGVILILIRRKRFGAHIPFGPFLALSTFTAFLWGEEIIEWIAARYF